MNEVVLVGRLTKDPELRTTNEGSDKARITIAVNRNFKDKNGNYNTDFFDILLWNSLAKRVNEWCKKGDTIGVRARLQNISYTDKEGKKVYKNEIVADDISFIANSQKKEIEKVVTQKSQVENESVNQETDPFANFGEEVVINDDDLPF